MNMLSRGDYVKINVQPFWDFMRVSKQRNNTSQRTVKVKEISKDIVCGQSRISSQILRYTPDRVVYHVFKKVVIFMRQQRQEQERRRQ